MAYADGIRVGGHKSGWEDREDGLSTIETIYTEHQSVPCEFIRCTIYDTLRRAGWFIQLAGENGQGKESMVNKQENMK